MEPPFADQSVLLALIRMVICRGEPYYTHLVERLARFRILASLSDSFTHVTSVDLGCFIRCE